jgi:hypothetical protein
MAKVMLAEGHVTPDSPLTVQLIKNHRPDARPTVVVVWPGHFTECSPAKLAEVVSNATRILGNASLELARRRVMPEQP